MISFVGLNGQIEVDNDGIILTRVAKLDKVFHQAGKIIIPFCQVENVVFSEGGLTNGFVAFLRKGDKEPHSVFSAIKNDTAVIFRLTKNKNARQLVNYVKSKI
ncbi:MAG: hypothetical protein K6G84_00545 [Lachnospiraceae bacterium]|nr:hypothetical protein [Lachnospiraceae bacterium]